VSSREVSFDLMPPSRVCLLLGLSETLALVMRSVLLRLMLISNSVWRMMC
jgi:hypothetical protein